MDSKLIALELSVTNELAVELVLLLVCTETPMQSMI